MLKILLVFVALLLACVNPQHDTANPAADFPGNLLQVDKYYTKHCIILACADEECNSTTVYTIKEKSGYLEDQEWEWTYHPPSLYIINEHEIYAYPLDDKCWELQGDVSLFGEAPWAISLNACPCELNLYE
jgi:hypothetical protein